MSCPYDYVGVGACGSGAFGNCGFFIFNKLKCCRTSAKINRQNCATEQSSTHGVKLSCQYGGAGHQKVVTGYCSAGALRNYLAIKMWAFYYIDCCSIEDGFVVEIEAQCYWTFGSNGEDLECSKGMIMTGVCGTDGLGWCPEGTYHGIKCCPFHRLK